MNHRNETYYTQQLMKSLVVRSYGNLHIISTINTRGRKSQLLTTEVSASRPSRADLVAVYVIFTKLRDGLSALGLSYQFSIYRMQPVLTIYKSGWSVVLTSNPKHLSLGHLIIRRVHMGMYGRLQYVPVYDSEIQLSNFFNTLNHYTNEQH